MLITHPHFGFPVLSQTGPYKPRFWCLTYHPPRVHLISSLRTSFYFTLSFSLLPMDAEGKTEDGSLKQKPWRNMRADLLVGSYSAPFLIQPRHTCPGIDLSTVVWTFLHQSAIKKIFLFVVPFSQICQDWASTQVYTPFPTWYTNIWLTNYKLSFLVYSQDLPLILQYKIVQL